MLHSPSAINILVRAWRWVGFLYSGFKTMYAAATKIIIIMSSVVKTWPHTKTSQSDEQQVANLVMRIAVESVIHARIK